ncbi:MAG: hypothetical protein AAF568_06460 [Pseudomonadota bacterium]
MFGFSAKTKMLAGYTADELRAIDADVLDLQFRLEDSFEIGIAQVLMRREPPITLIQVGETARLWSVNGVETSVKTLETTKGPLYGFEIPDGVAINSDISGRPEDHLVGLVSRDNIDATQTAVRRNPTALGLFLMLEEAGLTANILGVCHVETGMKGLHDQLLEFPELEGPFVDLLGRAAMDKLHEEGETPNEEHPSEHFRITLEGAEGMASAMFTEDLAVLYPLEGAEHLFETIPVIQMPDLTYEARALSVRMRRDEQRAAAN